jgi:hypothetical protein
VEAAATKVSVNGKELLIAQSAESPEIAVPVRLNRAQRRRMEREKGNRGAKAKRQGKPLLPETKVVRQTPEEVARQKLIEENKHVIDAAVHIRDMTGGGFWLPGDK